LGGENELSVLLPMDMRSVVTLCVPVSTGCIIGLRVILTSYRGFDAGVAKTQF
jgi:hypothetical protein